LFALFDTNWSYFADLTNEEVLKNINPDDDNDDSNTEVEEREIFQCVTDFCTPLLVSKLLTQTEVKKSYKGVCCQVCVFEGRKFRTKSVAYCNSHGIRACLTPPNVLSYINKKFENAVNNSTEEELSMWRCPDVNGSCWSKAHSFYI
jgi:hypothetical protein